MAAPATSPQRVFDADDRRAPRKAVVDSGLVTVEMCPAGFGLMVNVSERGMAVYTMKNLTPAQDVQVSFMLPGSPRRIECDGMVKWADDSHAGLKLKNFDAQSLTLFKRWIATLPEVPAAESPKLQRRAFPERYHEVRAIESHIADEHLQLDEALQFIATHLLDLTDANGAAIALGDPLQMVCRASAGLAPEAGVQISSTSGATGECIRTGREIYCEDTELDPRVDREACRELNLRSLLMVPVLRQNKVAGVLEAFSRVPAAFQDDHRWLVKRLAEMTATLAYDSEEQERIAEAPNNAVTPTITNPEREAPTPVTAPVSPPAETTVETIVRKQAGQRSLVARLRPFWPLSVFAGSVVLLSLALHNSKPAPAVTVNAPSPATASSTAASPSSDPTITSSQQLASEATEPAHASARHAAESASNPLHEAAASQVMALPPSTGAHESAAQPESAPAVQLASAAAFPSLAVPSSIETPELLKTSVLTGGALAHQVQPAYPPLALQMGRQGDVVLRAHINRQGKVMKIKLISGDPLLANAATAAVREWRYEPFKRDNVPQEIDNTITLRFRAPKR